MSKQIKMTSVDGVTLHTANRYVDDDIHVVNGLPTYSGENEGGEVVERSLKKLLDNTKSCEYLFKAYSNDNISSLLQYDDTENVENFTYMFQKSTATIFPLLNTSKGKKFFGTYYGCSEATEFPLIDVSNGEDFSYMYQEPQSTVRKFHIFPLLNTSKGKIFKYMYAGNRENTEFPLIDVSNGEDFSYMYEGCSKFEASVLNDLPDGSNCSRMYQNCSKIKKVTHSLGIPKQIDGLFFSCRELEKCPKINTSNCSSIHDIWVDCYKLPKTDISYFNGSNTSYSGRTWLNCYSLKAVIIREFGSNYVLNSNAFTKCYHILGTTDATYNPNGDQDGYIYVPRAMIETLQSATNWSSLYFRALEDYTLDGTTTGEFDDVKAGLVE